MESMEHKRDRHTRYSNTHVILDGNGGQVMVKDQVKPGWQHVPPPQDMLPQQDVSNIRRPHILASGPGGWGTGSTIEEARADMLKACGITPAQAATTRYAQALSTVKYDIAFYGEGEFKTGRLDDIGGEN
jgi:hypothetical protein